MFEKLIMFRMGTTNAPTMQRWFFIKQKRLMVKIGNFCMQKNIDKQELVFYTYRQ